MLVDRGIVAGNVTDKYRLRNPIGRYLMDGFLRAVGDVYGAIAPETVLEVGCGEGDLCDHLSRIHPARFVGTDLSSQVLDVARGRYPALPISAQSASELAVCDDAVDLTICCEVLEHLPDPEAALFELARVTRRHALLSVPWEPMWRVLNVARGSYIRELGNTPGHLQHWTRQGFIDFVSRVFRVRDVRTPLPWTVIWAEVR